MPYKDPEKKREYHVRYMREVWYPRNKKKHIRLVKHSKLKIREFIQEYKRERSCVDCGFSGKVFPQVLDFDHLYDKKFIISGSSKTISSLRKVKTEIKKCELVCANCHRVRTFTKRKEK